MCTGECDVSPYGGYACDACKIAQFSTGVLLDTPDKEASRIYNLKEYMRSIIRYDINREALDEIIEKIKSLLN